MTTPKHVACLRHARRGLLLAVAAVASCGGIPISALPKLASLPGQLLEMDPAQLRVALQVDARIAPPPDVVPRLHLLVKPKVAGAFEVVDRKLPLALQNATTAVPGLPPPGAGRRWLVYSLPPASQTEVQRIQAMVRQTRAQPDAQRGGSIALGIEQKDLAPVDPVLDRTRWSTWFRVREHDGYFEVWRGDAGEVRRLADAAR